jgi:murein DD-endopeptidase MepM/ murein hydrolase activator NlpD
VNYLNKFMPLTTVVLKVRRSFLLKPEVTQKVELVNTPKDTSKLLASRSSAAITDRASGFVKIAALFANRRRRASLMMLGLAVLVGIASFPTNDVQTVAVAAESAGKLTKAGSASDVAVAQLQHDVSAMQAKYGTQSSVLVAQSMPIRYGNRADISNLQIGSEASVTIDVASPKTKAFKPVATGQAAFNQGGSEGESKDYEDKAPSTQTGTTTLGFSWPASGKLTSRFGRRWGRMHKGIDIAGPVGTPINAAADGTVISAGWNSGGYGNLVEVKHSDGTTTRYGHNSRLSVSVGQTVRQGQQLAEMGSTGHSTGSHLHFEIRPTGGTAVNPIAHLPSNS